MSQETLRSIEVRGYRAIHALRLPRLEGVNLFVGRNNAGKTSLLEAVQLCASRTPRTVLASILRERSNFRPRTSASDFEFAQRQASAAVESVRSLFYGTFSGSEDPSIFIGPIDGVECLEITLPWAGSAEHGSGEIFLDMEDPVVQLRRGENTTSLSLDWFFRRFGVMLTGTSQSTAFVPSQGLDRTRIGELWDQAAEAGYATVVEDALRSVIPELERIYAIGEQGPGGRSVSLQLAGTMRPVPLTSMGDGTFRVFGLALSCVRARGGVVLIDEVENGLYHGVQSDVWKSVFALSEQFDVQVFATTHSWDAVDAFQDAANSSVTTGMLYRLERAADGSVYAERYTEEDVAIAAEQQIEVR